MTERRLAVLMAGTKIGEVSQEQTGKFRFNYEEDWRRMPNATPLSLSMPLTGSTHSHGVIEPFMWGLLPDNDRVLQRWGRDNQVSHRNPLALLAYVGEECAGAAQFVRPERVEAAARHGDVEWMDESYIAERIQLLRRDPTAWQTTVEHGQFSLAGAQAKMALLFRDGRWGRPSGRIPTSHIIKPAIEGFDDHDLNEHICLRAARLLGLRAVRSRVGQFESERAIVIERYDRIERASGLTRVHQEDFCQALGVPPTQKYQREGGPSPLQIGRMLREVDPSGASDSITAFVDALAFNWLVGGTDAHAKNYSILLSERQVRLAPVYDVSVRLPYPQLDRHRLKLAMSIGGEYRLNWIWRRHWSRLAKDLQLGEEAVIARVKELAVNMPDCFSGIAEDESIRGLQTPHPQS